MSRDKLVDVNNPYAFLMCAKAKVGPSKIHEVILVIVNLFVNF